MAAWKLDGLISLMSTMMTESHNPVELEFFLLNFLSKRSISELFPEPGGPIKVECAIFLSICPLSEIASATALMNSAVSIGMIFSHRAVSIEKGYKQLNLPLISTTHSQEGWGQVVARRKHGTHACSSLCNVV